MSTDRTYKEVFGFEPFKKKGTCKKCGSEDTYVYEEGADCDGGLNCMVRKCRTCRHEEEL